MRTGVTVILPRGAKNTDPVYAGWFSLNGNGEMTGTTWVEESGFLEGPVAITNTHSVGTVRDSMIAWGLKHGALTQRLVAARGGRDLGWVSERHQRLSCEAGQMCSRRLTRPRAVRSPKATPAAAREWCATDSKAEQERLRGFWRKADGGYTVGVLVQCNCGRRPQLTIAGVPVGKEIPEDVPYARGCRRVRRPRRERNAGRCRFDHHCDRNRCAAAPAPVETAGAAGRSWGWRGPDRSQAMARATSSSRSRPRISTCRRGAGPEHGADCVERAHHSVVYRHGGSDRGGDCERHGRRQDDDRHQRTHGDRTCRTNGCSRC